MATPRKGLPEVWVTNAAKFLVGEISCPFQVHFKAHHSKFTKMPNSFDSAAWKVAHTEAINFHVQILQADGWKCRLEQFVRVQGKGTALTGKIDVIAQKEGFTKIVDVKSGDPRDSHAYQVAIYMVALPMAWGTPNLHVTGEVVYRDGHTIEIEPHHVLDLKPKLFAFLRSMAGGAPVPEPSETGCRFCELTVTDCPQRFDQAGALVAETELF